jgi:uncharacterized membrane protein
VILLLIFLYALFRNRNWLKRVSDNGTGWYRKHIAKHVTPLSLLTVSGILFVFSFFSLALIFTKVLFVLFLGFVLYYMAHYLRARKEKRRKADGNTGIEVGPT